jgi:DNA polymerase delta subunit 3
MKDVFDEDNDDDSIDETLLIAANQADTAQTAEAKKAREEREAEIRKMMDDDNDEPMEDAPESPVEEPVDDSKALDLSKAPDSNQEHEQSLTHNGRRRGRRRVMKKKTYTDDEGYLVTREEPEWESFSEEEPMAKKLKPASKAFGGVVPKKPQPKGQGSIMSFFKK